MKLFSCPAVILLIITVSVLAAGCLSPVTDPEIAEMDAVSGRLIHSINGGLVDIKTGLMNNSQALAISGISGPKAEEILADNLRNYPWAYSSLTISREGIVMAAVPGTSRVTDGFDLSGQLQVKKAIAAEAPVVSGVYRMAEGSRGISQSCPVLSLSGEYLGYTEISYAPEAFLQRYIEPAIRGSDYDVWVVQTDGTEIFDTTREEIGKNILTDPSYADPALKAILSRIIMERSGSGTYTFQDREWNRAVTKNAVWDTAGIDGTEWRVVVTSTGHDGRVTEKKAPTLSGNGIGERRSNLIHFVERAAAYAKEQGRTAAVAEFNNPKGKFIDGEMYVFAYEMNGTVIALPYQQGLLGSSRASITDSNGVKYIDRMSVLAGDGGGFTYYIYPNPEDNYREEFKVSYVLPAGDGWFVGSGIYLPSLPATFSTTERDALVQRVHDARRYAQVNGAERAIADFNDRSGSFADGSGYIFAYAANGTTLALPFQQELIGSNRLDYADTFGIGILSWEIAEAERGGGFVYVEYLNPDTGEIGLKLCYVEPVDDSWFVGSGIYTIRL